MRKANFVVASLIFFIFSILTYKSSFFQYLDDYLQVDITDYNPPVVYVIDIDEESLQKHGKWPWDRKKIAKLLEKVNKKFEPAVIGVDILLPQNSTIIKYDEYLKNQIKNNVILSYTFSDTTVKTEGAKITGVSCNKLYSFPKRNKIIGLNEIFNKNSISGHVMPVIDSDGKVRRYSTYVEVSGKCYSSLALEIVKNLYGGMLNVKSNGFSLGYNKEFNISHDGTFKLIPEFNITSISASSVLDDSFTGDYKKTNAVFLIGSTAAGNSDYVPTNISNNFPGLYIHAMATQQILKNYSYKDHEYYYIVHVVIAAFILFYVTYYLNNIILAVFLILLHGGVVLYLTNAMILISPAYFLFSSTLTAVFYLYKKYSFHKDRSNLIRKNFESYVPYHVIDELIKSNISIEKYENTQSEITVMFADLRGFTKISEMHTPKKTAAIINLIMDYFSEKIIKHNGTIDKFIGDGVMAFWGAPLFSPTHADNAIQCAIEICDDIEYLKSILMENAIVDIDIKFSIGVATGVAAIGNMGSSKRRTYTAIGDCVNVAARLEKMCPSFNKNILISESTCIKSINGFYEKISQVKISGRDKPVLIVSPLAVSADLPDNNIPVQRSLW